MKENMQNIQVGLLVVIAAMVFYGTFMKEDSNSPRERSQRKRNKIERTSNIAATPPSQPGQPLQQRPQAPVNQPVNNPTSIAFEAMSHDFGEINQNSENNYTFNFTNTGNKPLIIETATGSCGCTVPDFPKEPIAPGATSQIKVQYKPGKQKGLQNKTITVIANTQPRDTKLSIIANVKEVK